ARVARPFMTDHWSAGSMPTRSSRQPWGMKSPKRMAQNLPPDARIVTTAGAGRAQGALETGLGAPSRPGSGRGVGLVAEVRGQPALRLRERPALAGGVVGDLVPADLPDGEVPRLRVREIE